MDIKAVIFDLDGVIVSTDHYHFLAWKKIADKEGIFFDETINNRLRGVSRMESLEIILEKRNRDYTDDDKLSLAGIKNDYYKQSLSDLSPKDILDGVEETLKALKEKNIAVAIGSSSKNSPLILKNIGLDGSFDAISDGNNITKSKPDPEVFLKAAQMLNLPPEVCMVVEDAKAGIDAAKNAGMVSVALGDAYGYEKSDFSVKNISELLDFI